MSKVALLIGVNSYPRDISYPGDTSTPLQKAVEDVARMKKFFVETYSKPSSHSTSYYQESFDTKLEFERLKISGSTRNNLLKWLESHLAKSPDVVLFYFSGHGIRQTEDTDYLRKSYSNFQYESDQNESDFLAFKTICSRLEQTPKTKSVVILDCCFSGAIVDSPNYSDESGSTISTFIKPDSSRYGDKSITISSALEAREASWRSYSRCLQTFDFYPNFKQLEETKRHEGISIFISGLGGKNRTSTHREFNSLADSIISSWKETFKCKLPSAIKELYEGYEYAHNDPETPKNFNNALFKSGAINSILRDKITPAHIKLINEYYKLSANNTLSEEQSTAISEILKLACSDKVLEFIVNETDKILMDQNFNQTQQYQQGELSMSSRTPEPDNPEFFVGRSDCLHRLEQVLDEKSFVLIHGMGGVGKTTLALRFAKHFKDNQNSNAQVLFTSFNVRRSYSNLAKDITIIPPGEVATTLVKLENQLKWEVELENRPCLLILDGLDLISNSNNSSSKSQYSINAIQFLLDKLTSKKQIQILITSRMVETWIEQPYTVVELPEFINPGLDETCPKQLKEIIDSATRRSKKSFSHWLTPKHIQLVCDYYRLSLLPRLTDIQGERISEVLALAKHDRILEFLCNETDDILIQKKNIRNPFLDK